MKVAAAARRACWRRRAARTRSHAALWMLVKFTSAGSAVRGQAGRGIKQHGWGAGRDEQGAGERSCWQGAAVPPSALHVQRLCRRRLFYNASMNALSCSRT